MYAYTLQQVMSSYPMYIHVCRRIKALEELTWDYSYDVGSVPGRNIDCLCGSAVCRGRLL